MHVKRHTSGYLGFDVDLSLPLGVVFDDARDDALVVAAVDAGTPAQQSGVAPGWRMRTLAGESVDSRAKLEERLLAARAKSSSRASSPTTTATARHVASTAAHSPRDAAAWDPQ